MILKFSEIYFDKVDDKVFDIKIGDHNVARDLDPFARAYGKYMPYDMFVEMTIKGGKLYIENREVARGIKTGSGEKFIQVDFLKGKKDNPKVNAILLVKGSASNTHKENFTNYQRLLLKLQEEREKKRLQEESFF